MYVNAICWQRGELLTGEMKTSLQNNSAKIIMENKLNFRTRKKLLGNFFSVKGGKGACNFRQKQAFEDMFIKFKTLTYIQPLI